MKDTDIADGARCVLDANVLIYAEQGHSKQASAGVRNLLDPRLRARLGRYGGGRE